MKQILQNFKTGELKLHDVPRPIIRKDGVLVKVYYSLVSAGTEKMMINLSQKSYIGKAKERPDLVKQVINKAKNEGVLNTYKSVKNKIDDPQVLGYSCVGEVVESGENVTDLKVGDLVACAGAGYANHAEYNYIPKNLVVKLNNYEKLKESSFVTLGAIAMQGIRQSSVTFGDSVAVIGLGLIGQITAQILKAAGCRVIGLDFDSSKVNLATKNGMQSSVVLGSEDPIIKVNEFTNGFGVDKVIITAATKENSPVELAAEIARDRAIVTMIGVTGMNIPRKPYYDKELEFRFSRSYGPGRYDYMYEEKGIDYPIGYVKWTENRNMQEFIRMIEENLVDMSSLITHEFKFNDSEKAYDLITNNSNKEKYIGILLEYDKNKKDEESRVYITQKKYISHDNLINIGLIGAGNFTKSVFIPNLKKVKEINFKAVASAGGVNSKMIGEKYNFDYVSSNYKELLEDDSINLIAITTTHNLHAKQVIESLKNNKHVYVEKPLCLNEEELEEIRSVYNKSNKSIMVGFNRRFSPHIQKIKEYLGTNTSQMVMTYRVNGGNIPKNNWINDPLVGGGRIVGEVCHFVDLLQYIANSKIEKIYAEKIKGNNDEIINEDNILITLTFENGSIGNIVYTSVGDKSYPKENIEIFANESVIKMTNFCRTEFYGKRKMKNFKTIGQNKGFEETYNNYIESILKGKETPITFEDIYNNTLATFKIRESLLTGLSCKIEN